MNHPNPFVPQGSVLEQHKRRSRMKLAVFCSVAISVCGLTAMLIQGCKREQTPADNLYAETNVTPMVDTNVAMSATNPVITPVAPVIPVIPEASGETYVVVKGDTLGKIATAHHVSLKSLLAANPNLQPTRLKVGDKVTIPAGGSTASTTESVSTGAGEEVYTVKAGDSLTKIATTHGITLKALKAANPNVDPNRITVGQKLKIPARAESAPAATTVNTPPAAVPTAPTSPAPAGQ